MADEAEDGAQGGAPKKKAKGGLLVGLVLALAAGGGAFALTSGMIGGGGQGGQAMPAMADHVAFVSVEPMTVAVGNPAARRYLRFRAELEVDAAEQGKIQKLMPRVVDVLNTYLQSLEMSDIEDPSALLTLRSQMRRRVDLVVGGDRVKDLLVMEFVVN